MKRNTYVCQNQNIPPNPNSPEAQPVPINVAQGGSYDNHEIDTLMSSDLGVLNTLTQYDLYSDAVRDILTYMNQPAGQKHLRANPHTPFLLQGLYLSVNNADKANILNALPHCLPTSLTAMPENGAVTGRFLLFLRAIKNDFYQQNNQDHCWTAILDMFNQSFCMMQDSQRVLCLSDLQNLLASPSRQQQFCQHTRLLQQLQRTLIDSKDRTLKSTIMLCLMKLHQQHHFPKEQTQNIINQLAEHIEHASAAWLTTPLRALPAFLSLDTVHACHTQKLQLALLQLLGRQNQLTVFYASTCLLNLKSPLSEESIARMTNVLLDKHPREDSESTCEIRLLTALKFCQTPQGAISLLQHPYAPARILDILEHQPSQAKAIQLIKYLPLNQLHDSHHEVAIIRLLRGLEQRLSLLDENSKQYQSDYNDLITCLWHCLQEPTILDSLQAHQGFVATLSKHLLQEKTPDKNTIVTANTLSKIICHHPNLLDNGQAVLQHAHRLTMLHIVMGQYDDPEWEYTCRRLHLERLKNLRMPHDIYKRSHLQLCRALAQENNHKLAQPLAFCLLYLKQFVDEDLTISVVMANKILKVIKPHSLGDYQQTDFDQFCYYGLLLSMQEAGKRLMQADQTVVKMLLDSIPQRKNSITHIRTLVHLSDERPTIATAFMSAENQRTICEEIRRALGSTDNGLVSHALNSLLDFADAGLLRKLDATDSSIYQLLQQLSQYDCQETRSLASSCLQALPHRQEHQTHNSARDGKHSCENPHDDRKSKRTKTAEETSQHSSYRP